MKRKHITPKPKNTQPRASHRVRDIKDASDVERGVGAVVQCVAGLVVRLSDVTVELLMLPVTNLLRIHHPQGLVGDRGEKTINKDKKPKQWYKSRFIPHPRLHIWLKII